MILETSWPHFNFLVIFASFGGFWANSACLKRNSKGANLCDRRGFFPPFIDKRQWMNSVSYILATFPSCYTVIIEQNVKSSRTVEQE